MVTLQLSLLRLLIEQVKHPNEAYKETRHQHIRYLETKIPVQPIADITKQRYHPAKLDTGAHPAKPAGALAQKILFAAMFLHTGLENQLKILPLPAAATVRSPLGECKHPFLRAKANP